MKKEKIKLFFFNSHLFKMFPSILILSIANRRFEKKRKYQEDRLKKLTETI